MKRKRAVKTQRSSAASAQICAANMSATTGERYYVVDIGKQYVICNGNALMKISGLDEARIITIHGANKETSNG